FVQLILFFKIFFTSLGSAFSCRRFSLTTVKRCKCSLYPVVNFFICQFRLFLYRFISVSVSEITFAFEIATTRSSLWATTGSLTLSLSSCFSNINFLVFALTFFLSVVFSRCCYRFFLRRFRQFNSTNNVGPSEFFRLCAIQLCRS